VHIWFHLLRNQKYFEMIEIYCIARMWFIHTLPGILQVFQTCLHFHRILHKWTSRIVPIHCWNKTFQMRPCKILDPWAMHKSHNEIRRFEEKSTATNNKNNIVGSQARFKPETPAELLKHTRARLRGGFCPPLCDLISVI